MSPRARWRCPVQQDFHQRRLHRQPQQPRHRTRSGTCSTSPPADQVVTGEQIASAKSDIDDRGPVVNFTYKGDGAKNFGTITRSTVNEANINGISGGLPNAIVVDDQLISTPVVNQVRQPRRDPARRHHNGSSITNLSKPEADGSRSRFSRAPCRLASRCCPRTWCRRRSERTRSTRSDRRHRRADLRDDLPAGRVRLPGADRRYALIIYGLLLAGS